MEITIENVGQNVTKALANGWDLNKRYTMPKTGKKVTLLTQVICANRLDLTKLLVEHGADINKKDVESSALDCAAALGHIEIVVYLVNKGADVNIKNKNGNTPLHSAIMFNRNRVVKYLLSKKALTIPYSENGKHVYVYELAIRCYADESYKELQKYASTLF